MKLLCVDSNKISMETKLIRGVATITAKEANLINKTMKKFKLEIEYIEGNEKVTNYYLTTNLNEDMVEKIWSYIEKQIK